MIRYIVNPKSGTTKKANVVALIEQTMPDNLAFDIVYTEYAGHAIELSKKALEDGVQTVVAVGGDGSVNEIGSSLIYTDATLGIIPMGSGNGLARHLNIPLNPLAAIKNIINGSRSKIDTGSVNGISFGCVAGVGFDAEISNKFKSTTERGFIGYIKMIALDYANFPATNYVIEINNKTIEREAFMISFANAAQFGNNAMIAPKASVIDGKLEICILKKLPYLAIPMLLTQLMSGTLKNNNYIEYFTAESISIKNNVSLVHVDGEPHEINQSLDVKINPLSLNVITPDVIIK